MNLFELPVSLILLVQVLTAALALAGAAAELITLPRKREQLDIPRGDWLTVSLGALPGAGMAATLVALYWIPPAQYSIWVGLPGLFLCVACIAIRSWSKKVLGRYYTFAIGLTQEHQVLQDGPYRYVRHPLYLGTFLGILGVPLLTQSWVAIVALTLPTGFAYGLRLFLEERYLIENFGPNYRDYAKRTAKLIPFVW